MPASARSPEPLDVKHGVTGYDLGCGCDKCKRAHAARVKRYRARKAAGTVGTPTARVPQDAGKFERGVREMVASMKVSGPEADLLVDMMVFNAQLLDAIPGNGRWHLAQGAQKAIRELREELRKLSGDAGGPTPPPTPGDNLEGFLNGLTKQG